MAKQSTMDLTQGRPIKQILLFSLPLVMGTLFQQLYSFVDTVMVGRLISDEALAAVGTTYSLNFLTLGFVQGACVGFGIPLAQSIGAKDKDGFKRYFWNGVWLCTILGAVLTVLTFLLAEPLLRMIKTPEEILGDATRYIQVIFLGIPATILYNFCAGALRAAGDSQRPTYFLLLSSLLNIVLDYVFIVPVPMGVAGAALATVLSQLVSGLLNLGWIIWKTDLLKDCAGLRGISKAHTVMLCKVGFPMGFEYSVSAVGAVIMQGAINSLSTAAIAGQTTGEKIRQMFTLPMESVGMGMATYAGQNDGAKRYDRIKDGIKRIGMYISENLLTRCDAAMEKTNAASRSEFICEAIEHYIAVLNAQENSKVLTPALESVMPDDKLYYRLGSINLHGIGTEKNLDRAREYLRKAAIMGNVDAVYGMGKLYLESDVQKAISMFQLAAEQGNSYAEYQLGKIYCFGQRVPQDLETGMEWLRSSAAHGNEYAAQLMEKVQNHLHHQTTSAVFGLFKGLAGLIQNSTNKHIRHRNSIDRKQRQKIEEKKQAHGQRSSGYEYDYDSGQTM